MYIACVEYSSNCISYARNPCLDGDRTGQAPFASCRGALESKGQYTVYPECIWHGPLRCIGAAARLQGFCISVHRMIKALTSKNTLWRGSARVHMQR